MTAVEWLINELQLYYEGQSKLVYYEIIEQAKEMERKQIIDFATQFAKEYIGFDSVSTDPNAASPAQHYYNQTKK